MGPDVLLPPIIRGPSSPPVIMGPPVHVPKIDRSNTNPGYPNLPQPPGSSSGSGSGSGSGSTPYTPPDFGSLPGAGDTGGDPGGNLQCDPVLNPCWCRESLIRDQNPRLVPMDPPPTTADECTNHDSSAEIAHRAVGGVHLYQRPCVQSRG